MHPEESRTGQLFRFCRAGVPSQESRLSHNLKPQLYHCSMQRLLEAESFVSCSRGTFLFWFKSLISSRLLRLTAVCVISMSSKGVGCLMVFHTAICTVSSVVSLGKHVCYSKPELKCLSLKHGECHSLKWLDIVWEISKSLVSVQTVNLHQSHQTISVCFLHKILSCFLDLETY